jgi:hypothetical protein
MVEALGTWFAGVATAGSFWLGFSILRRDRKKEASEQAQRVITSSAHSMRAGIDAGEDITLYVENASDRPIRLLAFIAEGRPVQKVIAELRTTGAKDDPLLRRLQETEVIGPILHEGWVKGSTDPEYPIDELKSGARTSFKILFVDFPRICYELDFSFTDANGVYWRKDIQSGKLLSADDLGRRQRWQKLRHPFR